MFVDLPPLPPIPPFHPSKNLGFARISWVVLLEAKGSKPPARRRHWRLQRRRSGVDKNLTWGLTSLPLPFYSIPFLLSLPYFFLFSSSLSPSLRSMTPNIQLKSLESTVSFASRIWGEAPDEIENMRSGDNNFNYFPENQLTELAHLVQFKRVLMSCLGIEGLSPLGPLGYATGARLQRCENET